MKVGILNVADLKLGEDIIQYIDPETGELMCDDEGKEIKIRGKKNVKPYFEQHPELWRKLYDKVYEKLSEKENPNIIAFEKMLNINIDETFNISEEEYND